MALTQAQRYQEYLEIIANPDNMIKRARLEFLNADGTVAFAVGNSYIPRYQGKVDTRTFLQEGTLNVSLQNGQRRKASITLENLDGAFDYAVNKIWFGQAIKLSMGVQLSDGSDYLIPQGIFYIDEPQVNWSPNSRTSTYNLVDKWSYLNGNLFGNLDATYEIDAGENIFDAMDAILKISRYTHQRTYRKSEMIDNVTPIFTNYYNSRMVTVNGEAYPMNVTPQKIVVERSGNYSNVLTQLNDVIVGWIGYDNTGALRVEPSQDDILDVSKPVLWAYSPDSKTLLKVTETSKPAEVYNDIIVWGESLNDNELVGGRATNYDASSDTNAKLIGLKTYTTSSSGYYTNQQCMDLAEFLLKRKTVLQKSVTVSSTQMFHLQENNLITLMREDKPNSPIERHLIQSFSLPIAQTGAMSITATSVVDFPLATVTSPLS